MRKLILRYGKNRKKDIQRITKIHQLQRYPDRRLSVQPWVVQFAEYICEKWKKNRIRNWNVGITCNTNKRFWAATQRTNCKIIKISNCEKQRWVWANCKKPKKNYYLVDKIHKVQFTMQDGWEVNHLIIC